MSRRWTQAMRRAFPEEGLGTLEHVRKGHADVFCIAPSDAWRLKSAHPMDEWSRDGTCTPCLRLLAGGIERGRATLDRWGILAVTSDICGGGGEDDNLAAET